LQVIAVTTPAVAVHDAAPVGQATQALLAAFA